MAPETHFLRKKIANAPDSFRIHLPFLFYPKQGHWPAASSPYPVLPGAVNRTASVSRSLRASLRGAISAPSHSPRLRSAAVYRLLHTVPQGTVRRPDTTVRPGHWLLVPQPPGRRQHRPARRVGIDRMLKPRAGWASPLPESVLHATGRMGEVDVWPPQDRRRAPAVAKHDAASLVFALLWS